MIYATAKETAAGITLHMHQEAWMIAQWMVLEKTQKKWKEENMGDDHKTDMRAYFGI